MACLVTGVRPLIRHALRRATFPVGEGDLRRGLYTLSWERVAGPKALTGVGRTKPTARRSLSQPGADSSLYAREPAPLPFRLRRATFPQGKVRERSRRRKPSPTGKVDRAQPGPDEGCRAKITKKATLNGKRFRSTWPVFDFWVVFPHPSRLTACHLPRGGRRPPAGEGFTAFSVAPTRPGPGADRR